MKQVHSENIQLRVSPILLEAAKLEAERLGVPLATFARMALMIQTGLYKSRKRRVDPTDH